ncbi:MAG TPA: glycosyltransferase family 2 protein [Verrucomicrobiae bacterium]|jgi:hypothetical protein
MRPSQISLIISTYQRPDALDKLLRGVANQTEKPGQILIADDGSGPATRNVIEQWNKEIPLRHVWHEDKGFRKTIILNKSLAEIRGDYVVLLDGDCVPHRQFIADHALLAERNFWVQGRRCFVEESFVPKFDVNKTSIASAIMARQITGWPKAIRWPWASIARNTGQRGIIGCNMGFWRDDLVAINGFDEDYIGWGGEDSDLGTRMYNLGRPRKFVYGRAIVYHLNHPPLDRARGKANFDRLAETIRSGKVQCERGMQQYINA